MHNPPRLSQGRRIVLEFLWQNGRNTSRTCLIKWLFLLAQETDWGRQNPPYDFIPYKFGAFSFVAYRDIDNLARIGLLQETEDGVEARVNGSSHLPKAAQLAVKSVLHRYGDLTSEELLRYTYGQYPWFSVFSERQDLVQVNIKRPVAKSAVYTVGYSGRTIDGLLNCLLQKGLSGVVDIRRVPLSRRYGFHGKTLALHLSSLGLKYFGQPELGVETEARRGTNEVAARKVLLTSYRRRVLRSQMGEVEALAEELKTQPLALLCLEADPAQCHRSVLADILADISSLRVYHL